MPKAKSRPEFAYTTRDQIGVFVQIGGALKRAQLCRIIEAKQIKHLTVSDLLKHSTNVVSICFPYLFQPFQTIWQRIQVSLLSRILLERYERIDMIDNHFSRNLA